MAQPACLPWLPGLHREPLTHFDGADWQQPLSPDWRVALPTTTLTRRSFSPSIPLSFVTLPLYCIILPLHSTPPSYTRITRATSTQLIHPHLPMPRVADAAPVKREAGARGSTGASESTAASPHANGHAHEHANGNGTPIKVDSSSDNGAEAAADAAPTFLQEAKRRHEADLAKHAYEPPRPERVQDE